MWARAGFMTGFWTLFGCPFEHLFLGRSGPLRPTCWRASNISLIDGMLYLIAGTDNRIKLGG